MNLPNRKQNRLKNYNYNCNGAYFITICIKERKKILSDIVGTGLPDCPITTLSPEIELKYYGKIADKYINQLNNFYNNISIDKYVIMPDHIHLLISVLNGQSGTPVPTENNINSIIPKFVSTFKRFCNKEYGKNVWQERYYDHIIRNEQDFIETYEYIENNPIKWILKHKSL